MRSKVLKHIKCTDNKIKKAIDNSEIFRTTPELTNVTGWTLGFIHQQQRLGNKVFQKDIEKEFNINRSTASELLTTMENNGYIQRVTLEEDKRCRQIVLTEKTILLQQEVNKCIGQVEAKALDGFTEEEIETLSTLLERIYKNLDRKDDVL